MGAVLGEAIFALQKYRPPEAGNADAISARVRAGNSESMDTASQETSMSCGPPSDRPRYRNGSREVGMLRMVNAIPTVESSDSERLSS